MSAPPPPSTAAPKPRPYRRFVVSALHSRFVQVSCLTLTWNLAIAFCTAEWHNNIAAVFWALFPLGFPGIKALLFALSSVLVLISQITTLQIGRRNTPSRLNTLRVTLLSRSALATVLVYVASAWWFGEVFVWTSSASNNLAWIVRGDYGAPDRLNERPIYLRFFFVFLAMLQACVHLYYDKSSISRRIRPLTDKHDQPQTNSFMPPEPLWAELTRDAPRIASRAATVSALATILSPFLYTLFFRASFWTAHVTIAKAFANITRQDARPPTGFYVGGILLKAFFFGTLLCLSWELNTIVFRAYMLQEPIKKGTPLSSLSKDPNGTLINGLTAKRDPVRFFAFWELAIIAAKIPDHRKAVFADFDRASGPALDSIVQASLAVLAEIDGRMAALTPAQPAPGKTSANDHDPNVKTLPKLLPPTRQSKNSIFAPSQPVTRSDKFSTLVSHEAQILGSSPDPFSPPQLLSKYSPSVLEYTKPALDDLRNRSNAAAQSPVGAFLLSTPARLINSVVLGSPVGNAAVIIDAIDATTRLLVASLQEDTFGKAVQSVPPAVKQFTKTLIGIETFVQRQTGGIGDENSIPEVAFIHQKLRLSLSELTSAFRLFLLDIGLGTKDFHDAEKACQPHTLLRTTTPEASQNVLSRPKAQHDQQRPEMEQVRPQQQKRQATQAAPQQKQPDKSQQRPRTISAGSKDRPGRLFRHLDDDFVASNTNDPSNMHAIEQSNVLGARDFGSLPAGGLSRRRVTEVR